MSKNRQLDLFVALIGDVPFRDEREAMSAPLVALSKNKRTRRLRRRHPAISHQLHRLKLELAAELPSLHGKLRFR